MQASSPGTETEEGQRFPLYGKISHGEHDTEVRVRSLQDNKRIEGYMGMNISPVSFY